MATMTPQELADCLYDKTEPEHNIAALEHRQRLIQAWSIPQGSSILEIGPGQGDFTVCLADAVGPTGKVVAVDPAPLDWGTPSYATSRAFVMASPLGPRIEFVKEDPIKYLESLPNDIKSFDFIAFCHSIWYFSHPSILPSMLSASKNRIGAALIGEYSMSTTQPAAVPHVLTALAANAIEAFRGEESERNIRAALTPAQMEKCADETGWSLSTQQLITPGSKQLDAFREVHMVVYGRDFDSDLNAVPVDDKIKVMLRGMRDAVTRSVQDVPGGTEGVRNMDVWVARFEPKAEETQ
ncbi:hypothetical protein NLG97_g2015 [Lecanicillium saksenae]|uniref:Uncharacterized protein n=1 Tax=Lecanicillium saksenae TaxID=468837 RepID=A0ACC1R3H0_9HYPO|nr:hypothetical protein NLG97_g2015 [Lecanicillium saksenae]